MKYSQELRKAFLLVDDSKIELVKAIDVMAAYPETQVLEADANAVLSELLLLLNNLHAIVSHEEDKENGLVQA